MGLDMEYMLEWFLHVTLSFIPLQRYSQFMYVWQSMYFVIEEPFDSVADNHL